MDELPKNIVPITSKASRELASFGSKHGLQLLTILFTDLVDSTKLQSELGNVESARLTELHRKLVSGLLAEYDAKEIEWAGDSCLAVFTKPSDGVVFALRLQAAIRAAQQTEPKMPSVRIGLHLGEIVVRHHEGGGKDDLFGLQLSEAARIMSLARAGQVYCSRSVFENARSSLTGRDIAGVSDIAYVNHGPFVLKGVPDPVEICEVLDADLVRPKAPEANDKCRPAGLGARLKAKPLLTTGVAVAVAVVLFGIFFAAFRPGTAETPTESYANDFAVADAPKVRRYALALPPDQPMATPTAVVPRSLDISPDGQTITYRARTPDGTFLVVRRLDELKGRRLEGSQNAERQVFSPDGKWIAAQRARKLIKLPVDGGAPVTVTNMPDNFFIAWSENGDRLFFTPGYNHGLYRVSASGGTPEVLTTLEEGSQGHAAPIVLPGGRGIIYTSFTTPNASGATAMVLDLSAGKSKPVLKEAAPIGYLPNGYLILTQLGGLTALPFDADTLEATGPPFDVTQSRMTTPDTAPTRLAVSKSGSLLYVPIDLDETDALKPVWITPDGQEIDLDIPPDRYTGGAVSPDGKYLALVVSNGDYANLWLHDLQRGTTRKLTYRDVGMMSSIVWARDSRSIFYSGAESGSWAIHRVSIDGTSDPELIRRVREGGIRAVSVSPDGSELIYRVHSANQGLYALSLDGAKEPRSILDGPGLENNAEISPNGHWIAYDSDESGRREVYVQRYPEEGSKQQVSREGGWTPTWSADGTTLFFVSSVTSVSSRISAVDVSYEPQLSIGMPRTIKEGLYYSGSFDTTGNRFIMLKSLSSDTFRFGGTELIVVEHWDEEVRQREPKER